MALEYSLDRHLRELTAILEEYSEWFMHLLRRVSYPSEGGANKELRRPESFTAWAGNAMEQGFHTELVTRLVNLNADLGRQSEKILTEIGAAGRPPAYKEYDKLVTYFEEFIHLLRRLEQDCVLEDSGIDALTGLRSFSKIEADIRRELDRLARQGKPFSLALVRIDNLDRMKTVSAQEYIRLIAGMIKKSVRSFDDAYRLETNEFILSLKQADMNGGIRALERLKKELESTDVMCEVDGKVVPLTLSSCITVPDPGDDVAELLANLRVDLDESGRTEGTVLQYIEMSPLQRFVKDQGRE